MKTSIVNSDPAIVYTQRSVFFMGILSAITPSIGLDKATIAVDKAIPKLHKELPVKVIPKNISCSPNASLNRKTK